MTAAFLIASVSAAVLAICVWVQQRRYAALRMRLEASLTDLERLQQACSMFAPPGVVQRVAADGSFDPLQAAERKVATVLFADLVGYTAMSERHEPAVLAHIVNGYLQRMSDAVEENGGQLSQVLGDGILAYFGALRASPWQCDDAVRAALAMRNALAEFNRELAGEGLGPVGFGVGIHRGEGLAGMIGTRQRMDYAFIGPTVNVAARVESLTRVHGVDILVTDEVRRHLANEFRLAAMNPVSVKGISEPVATFAVIGAGPA